MSATTIDVSGELKLADVRKQGLRKTFEQIELQSSSILFLAIQWNDMESHFDSVRNSLLQRQEQLVSFEESLRKRLEEVKSREERVESLQESVNCRLKEIESNEAKEKLVFDERMSELDSMRVALQEWARVIEISQAAAEEVITDLALKEEQFRMLEESSNKSTKELEDIQKSVRDSLEEFGIREKHLSFVEKWSQERIEEIELRESRITESVNAIDLEMKEIKVKEKRLNEHEKALMFKEKRLAEQYARVESKEKGLVERENTFVLKSKQLEERSAELESLGKKLNERVEEVELNDRMAKERIQELELEDGKLNVLAEALLSKEQGVKERGEELETKERELKERIEEVESRECRLKKRTEELEVKDREVKQRANEVDLSIDREVNKRCEELESRDREVKVRAENLELKERKVKELAEQVELKDREIKLRAEKVDLKDREVKDHAREVVSRELKCKSFATRLDLKDQDVKERSKKVDLKEQKVKARSEEFDLKERKLKERAEEVELKDREVKRRAQEVDVISEEVDLLERKVKDRDKELELKEKEVKQRADELESQEKKFGELQKKMSGLEDTLMERYMDIELKDDMVKKHAEKLVLEENTHGERLMRFESTENELAKRSMELDAKENGLLERIEEVDLKEVMLDQRIKEVELKEKQQIEQRSVVNQITKGKGSAETVVSETTDDKGSAENVICDIFCNVFEKSTGNKVLDYLMCKLARMSEIMNGQSFQMYSSNRWKEHEAMCDEVAGILRESADPGQLVLDAMQEFYPLSTENENLSMRLCVMRIICIILLEGLLKVSPQINCDTTLAAANFAFGWTTKMRVEPEYDLEVLGFLLFLAAYDLASRFDNTTLITYLRVVTRHRQASKLCHCLGLVDKISDIIGNLIKEEKYLDAFEMICTFKLACKFQPVPLLRAYLGILRPLTNGRLELNSSTKLNVYDKRIADFDRVIKCIKDQEQCSGYSSKSLRNFVLELTQNKADIKKKKRAFVVKKGSGKSRSQQARLASKMRQQQQCLPGRGISRIDLNVYPSADSVSPSMQFPHQQDLHTVEASGAISTQIETKQKKALHLKVNSQTCKATFEQLMTVPTDIRHHRKEAAIELALQLKANINREVATKTDVFHFLRLVANYDLASSFSSDELVCCIRMIQRRKEAPDFFMPLGLLNEVPGFIENLLKENCCLDAIRFISQFDLSHMFPLVPILQTHLNGIIEKTRMLAHLHPEDQNHSATRELSASRTVLKHIKNSKLELEYPPKILEDRIKELEDQIARNAASNKVIQQKNQGYNSTTETSSRSIHPQLQLQKQVQPQHQSGIMLSGPTDITDSPPSNATTAHSNQTPADQAQQVTQVHPHPQAQPSHQSGTKRPRADSTDCHPIEVIAHSDRRSSKRKSTSGERYWSQNSSGHHDIEGYPPMSRYSGSYPNINSSYYDAGQPYYSNPPTAYVRPGQTVGPAGYLDHLMSYGGHGNGYRHPDQYHNEHALPPSHMHGRLPAHNYPSFSR